MSTPFITALAGQSAVIQEQWHTLLKGEPVSGPLANPDTLQYLVPSALEKVLGLAADLHGTVESLRAARAELPVCDCGNNPYRSFYIAGEQAITEAAVVVQSQQPVTMRKASDLAELVLAIRLQARRFLRGVCSPLHRQELPVCWR